MPANIPDDIYDALEMAADYFYNEPVNYEESLNYDQPGDRRSARHAGGHQHQKTELHEPKAQELLSRWPNRPFLISGPVERTKRLYDERGKYTGYQIDFDVPHANPFGALAFVNPAGNTTPSRSEALLVCEDITMWMNLVIYRPCWDMTTVNVGELHAP